jgi:hypothetical protein
MERVGGLVNRIGGKKVIPIHTGRPDMFRKLAKKGDVVLPTKGKSIPL